MAEGFASLPPELASLRDLHLPARISIWSFAPSWYVLVICMVLLILVVTLLFWRSKKRNSAKRHGLYLLRKLQESDQVLNNPALCSGEISKILRRVALVYYPRSQVAGLYGLDWLIFLTNTSDDLDLKSVQYELLELPYQLKPSQPVDLNNLFIIARTWISQRSKPCLS